MDFLDSKQELSVAEEVIRSFANERPAEVRDLKVEWSWDVDKGPLLLIWAVVDEDQNPPKDKLRRLNHFFSKIQDGILERGIVSWPSIRVNARH
jgi:hypothetical protein